MNYYEYLQSDEWQRVRARTLRHWGYRCATCGSKERLEVHHRTYKNLGQEKLNDVVPMCHSCHRKFHNSETIIKKIKRLLSRLFRQIRKG